MLGLICFVSFRFVSNAFPFVSFRFVDSAMDSGLDLMMMDSGKDSERNTGESSSMEHSGVDLMKSQKVSHLTMTRVNFSIS